MEAHLVDSDYPSCSWIDLSFLVHGNNGYFVVVHHLFWVRKKEDFITKRDSIIRSFANLLENHNSHPKILFCYLARQLSKYTHSNQADC